MDVDQQIKNDYDEIKSVLNDCLEGCKFRFKEIEAWERLYRKFSANYCNVNKFSTLKEMWKRGTKYMACANMGSRHECMVIPIIIGSYIDKNIQKHFYKDSRELEEEYNNFLNIYQGTILNFGFFSYFPKYLKNNNNQILFFKSYNKIKTKTLYLYDKDTYGYMIYLNNITNKLTIKMPSKYEYEIKSNCLLQPQFNTTIPLSFLTNLFEYRIGGKLIDFNIDNLFNFFSAIEQTGDIDDINNKTVAYAPILLENLLNHIMNIEDSLKIKSIRRAITSGNLFYMLIKKNTNQTLTKTSKEVNRNIIKNGNCNIYSEKYMYCNVDENNIDNSLNQIKRFLVGDSKYIKYTTTQNSTGIISPFYCANINNANKNLLLTHHTRITFVNVDFMYKIYKYCHEISCCNCLQEHGAGIRYKLVFNSVPISGKFTICDAKLVEFYVKLKMLHGEISIDVNNGYILIFYQSGLLQFPIQTVESNKPGICVCKNMICPTTNDYFIDVLKPLNYLIEKYKRLPRLEYTCDNHIFINTKELEILTNNIKQRYNLRYFQIMCHDSIKVAKYVNFTMLPKIITAVKNYRGIYSNRVSTDTNKELTRGVCKNTEISLFTVFYDYKGFNNEDGYVLNENVDLGIKLFIKNSVIFSFDKKSNFYIDDILEIVDGIDHSEIHICKIYSPQRLIFKEKRTVIQLLSSSSNLYIYLVKIILVSNIIKKIDKKSLEIRYQTVKNNVTISMIYNTIPNCMYNIKLSNSFGQKGMVKIKNLDDLTTDSGRPVELTANPLAIIKRSAFGQIKDMQDVERVYHNGNYIGMGGVCKYFIVNTFPHENIHGGVLGSAMKLDKLAYNASIGNLNPLIAYNDIPPYQLYSQPMMEKIFSLFEMFNYKAKCENEHNFIY